MKRRLISVLLIVAVAMALISGCAGDGTTTPQQSSKEPQKTTDPSQSETTPTTIIDMEEDPYTVAIQVVVLPGTNYEGREDREAAINAITLPAINTKVQIQEVWISEVRNTTSMAVAGDEKIDLIHVATVQRLSSMVGADLLYDMNQDDLLATRGQEVLEVFSEELLEAGFAAGQQLAIPAKPYNANAKGIYYNKTFADQHNITVPEKMKFEDLTEIFRQVKAADPEIMPYYSGSGELNYLYWLKAFEGYGSEQAYGIILDPQAEPTVVNFYETDMYKDYILTMHRWKKEGLQPGDPTDSNPGQAYFAAGQLFAVVSDINSTIMAQRQADYKDFELGWVTLVEPVVTNATTTEYMWGIASNSQRPDKAMDFLNFMYENGEVANILSYGLKDVDYTFVDGSNSVIARTGSYAPTFFVGGNPEKMLILSPNGEDYVAKLKEMEANATLSPLLGYTFDDSAFQTESSVINSTILEYIPRLNNGMADSEEATLALLAEFNQKLKLSGIDDVIAANQEQINQYLKNQG